MHHDHKLQDILDIYNWFGMNLARGKLFSDARVAIYGILNLSYICSDSY